MEQYLGMDIGGTNVKWGVFNTDKNLVEKGKRPTASFREQDSFISDLLDFVGDLLKKFPLVKKVGIGVPGMLDKTRKITLELPNIPELNGIALYDALKKSFPQVDFFLENDANAAALGEYHFSENKLPDDFVFLTLGTGVGGAAIINRKIFTGGDGNGMEIGHVLVRNGQRLETIIGKQGMLDMATEHLKTFSGKTSIESNVEITSNILVSAATTKDQVALDVFHDVGEILAEALVGMIRILDIKTIVIGGGLSAGFDFFYPALSNTLQKNLTPYYTKDLRISRATLGNEAGIVGAASLCF